MEANNSSRMGAVDFRTIESLVHQGKTIVSSEDSAISKWAIEAITGGRHGTLYLKPSVFDAIRRWYWTPERAELVGLKPISADEAARVKQDFDIEVDGHANRLECPRCRHFYSTYEFIQQGFKEHGEEHVRAAFSLKQAAILQINPAQTTICQNCHLHILALAGRGIRIHYHYDYWCISGNRYACCNDYVVATLPDLAVSRLEASQSTE